ncbi:putative MFS-type transporter C3E7.06c [Verticillium dahliae VDG2]|nr:putative MFS-type transporter C3E7.06c [Verticillium dahliae VDG2]
MVSPPTRRPPPSNGSALGPVPPTPADWIDQDVQQATPTPSRGRAAGLTIDTTQPASSSQVTELTSSASLSRAGAVRLDKTIVQRRAESRTRQHESMDGILQPMQLTDIVVPNATTLSRRRTINKSTPRSGGRTMQDTPQTGGSDSQRDPLSLTPKALGSAHRTERDMATPPFSPRPGKAPATDPRGVAPKALPTPPLHSRSASASQTRGGRSGSLGRAAATPSDSAPSSSTTVPKTVVVSQTADQFCQGTIERFEAFAASEAPATSDGDRVRLFADFIVSESRIRRERYASAIGAMGSEIFDLTRDLFRPMAARRESGIYPGQSQFTPLSSQPSRSHRGSIDSAYRDVVGQSSSAPTSANTPSSPLAGPPNNGTWTSNYMPSLSPILSLSVSGNGDGSSRGRPPSRWWESDSAGTGGHLMERSKRESKYMGMPKEAREALQWGDSPVQDELHTGVSEPDASAGYPPEKTGWHDQESALTPQPVGIRSSTQSLTSSASPTTPGPAQLDISRLVTLPPPYPRHHPAVNNNHPELTATRTAVRQISDLSEIEHARARYQQTSRKKREEATKAASERRSALRSNLQQEINSGNMSFAEASAIEQDSNESEREGLKDLEKADFEHFQSQVVIPLNELLTGRIAKANALFDGLASRLFDDVESAADMPQEEGDDKPELLEKLTLLKWIFEASEVLHRANYDLLSDRNDRYRDVVVTPYRLANNQEKVRSAEAFFAEDAAKRQLAFANEVLERTRTFQNVMEQNVVRGVEVQLSAFWDIAPPLSRLLDKVPGDLSGGGFRVQIPAQEYQENPTYHQHPLQYLFSLVLHAEKSTYQFIESQTNLLCLLHEVKEATAHAQAKVVQNEEGGERADALRQEEEKRLTEDLKEKVRVVQDQWHSALGEGVKGVKQTVGEWLLQTGGWDETLEDGGVGSV